MAKVRSYFDRVRVPFDTGSESLVEQHHANECNINTIVAKARRGVPMPFVKEAGLYGDFTKITDFASARNQIIAAEQAFMALPAALRARFKHDPANLLAFLDDESNRKEAESLGLVIPMEVVEKVVSESETSETPASSPAQNS
nr:MAG: internal scaffolding protein [Microvirus sp.]